MGVRFGRPSFPCTANTAVTGSSSNRLYIGSSCSSEPILSCDPTENWFGCSPLATSRNRATVIAIALSPLADY